MIVADTSAILALIDRNDRHHSALREVFLRDPTRWILPYAILPELDYLLGKRLGSMVRRTFLEDIRAGRWSIEWGTRDDFAQAVGTDHRYGDLDLGLVDAIVIAVAERLHAQAIATLDLRHFGTVAIEGMPALIPRDPLGGG